MATKQKPKEDEHYVMTESGHLIARRRFEDLIESFQKEDIPDYLSLVDHSVAIDDKQKYEDELEKQERTMNELVRRLKDAHKSLIVVFQGRDAAGKSGATERIIEALDYDMSLFQAVHVGPPTEDEKEHPFLWRFNIHERQPQFGQARVFDRSWFERVLVEPVMGYVKKDDYRASYAQIRAYEWLLTSQGAILVKFWLDITKKEQQARFDKRAKRKPWKFSEADEIARSHWDDYTDKANEMFFRTGTHFAPWYIISSQDKKYSRIAVLQIINQALKSALDK